MFTVLGKIIVLNWDKKLLQNGDLLIQIGANVISKLGRDNYFKMRHKGFITL